MDDVPEHSEMISVTMPRGAWRQTNAMLLELARLWGAGVVPPGGETPVMYLLEKILPIMSTAGPVPELTEKEGRIRDHFETPISEDMLARARGVVKQIPNEYWKGGGES